MDEKITPDQSIFSNHLPFGFTRHKIIKRIVGYYYSCRSGSQFQDKAIIARGVEHMGVGAEDATAWNRNYTALFAKLPGREMKPLLMRRKNTRTKKHKQMLAWMRMW